MAHCFLKWDGYAQNANFAALIERNFTDIIIPAGTKSIGTYAFAICTSLTSVTIPDSVTSIGSYAFYGCTSLARLEIPDSVTSIGTYAFYYCTQCTVYDFSRHRSVPVLQGADVFGELGSEAKILVPRALYREWIEATNWNAYEDYIVAIYVNTKDKVAPDQSKFNIYINAEQLKNIADATGIGMGESVLQTDENVPFVRFYGDDSSPEAYATAVNLSSTISGNYLSFAYRVSDANIEEHAFFDIFANTSGASFTGENDVLRLNIDKDGKWHVVVIDLAEALNTEWPDAAVKPDSDGSYTIQRLRIDFFNVPTSSNSYIDVAYVGMCDNIDNARAADPDWEGYTMVPGRFEDNDSSVSYVENVDENGMTYYTVTSTTTSGGEKGFVFHSNNYNYIANTSKYIGIMYRDAPGGYAQIYCGSAHAWESVVSVKQNYDTSDGWHYMILAIDNNLYKDSVCQYLRFDYFNGLAANTQYSVDIASVKFFASETEAKSYYEGIIAKYALNPVEIKEE